MMKINNITEIIIFVIISILLLNCKTTNSITVDNYTQLFALPNGVKIGENLYCDQSEVENFGWHEYMYWTKFVFGDSSKEYLTTMPSTSKELPSNNVSIDCYFYDYCYKHYPILGISHEQAKAFTKWRTDRVFEMLLINLHKIEFDTTPTKSTHFTIERYFNGTFLKTKGDKVSYYPEFRMPTEQDSIAILNYIIINNHNKQVHVCEADTLAKRCSQLNFQPVRCCDEIRNQPVIIHFEDNVDEWTATSQAPNLLTSFRNVCEWKRWEK